MRHRAWGEEPRLWGRPVKINPRELREDVETVGVVPKAKETGAIREVLRPNAAQTGAKCSECVVRSLGIGRFGLGEDVNVLRESGLGVKDYGLSANDQVLNSMGSGRRTKGLCRLGSSGCIFHPLSA
jgi:hypothetical protein